MTKLLTNLLLAAVVFTQVVAAGTIFIHSIDVYPASTTANVVAIFNASANMSVNYGTTTGLGTFANNSAYGIASSVQITGLIPNATYFYNIQVCDSANNCTTSVISAFNTVLIQSFKNTSDKGMDISVFLFLLAVSVAIFLWGRISNQGTLAYILSGTAFLICGFMAFNGLSTTIQTSTNIIQIYNYNFYIQSFGVILMVFAIYTYLLATLSLMKFMNSRKRSSDAE